MQGSSLLHRVAHVAFGRRLSERLWLFAFVFLSQLRVLLAYIPFQTEVPSDEVLSLVLGQLLRIGGWASLLTAGPLAGSSLCGRRLTAIGLRTLPHRPLPCYL